LLLNIYFKKWRGKEEIVIKQRGRRRETENKFKKS